LQRELPGWVIPFNFNKPFDKMITQKKILALNRKLVEYFGIPERATKLPDPLDLLIATILSQNTNDKNSYKAYQNLRKRFPRWEMIEKAEKEEIEKLIKVAGLAKQKSAAIKNLITSLMKKSANASLNFVREMENNKALSELTKFPGIGIKTASCVLLFALDRDVCPVDTHVHRTLNRIGLLKTSSPEKTFFELNANFPQGIAHQFHTNLIRLGREICTAKKPNCAVCPILDMCKYQEKNFEEGKRKDGSFMLLDSV
jgi:endonuclease-3